MDSENCRARRGSGLAVLLPLIALFGVIAGIGCCKRHCHCGEEHEEHDEGKCGHRGHGHCRHCSHDHEAVRNHGPGRQGFDPMRLLDKRFAAGEIDEDEYLRRRTVLNENS
jgi:hypothetical protein